MFPTISQTPARHYRSCCGVIAPIFVALTNIGDLEQSSPLAGALMLTGSLEKEHVRISP